MKVAIVIPSPDTVQTDFALSLVNLVSYSNSQGVHIVIVNERGSCIDHIRNRGVKSALELNPDHILFIDSDQTFPADGLVRLLAHKKMIVSATSVTRRPPVEFTARDKKGVRIDFRKRRGLHEVGSNGCPFMLIDVRVFNERMQPPWFKAGYNLTTYTSEDEAFCRYAKSKGLKIWVDADLSNQIGHVGSHVYTPGDMS